MNLETPQMLWFLVPILIAIGIMFKKDIDVNKIKKITIFLIRSLVIILLIIAITQPFVLKEKISETKKPITLLLDESNSFKLFENEENEILIERLRQQKINTIKFGNEKETDLADSISKLEKDSSAIILSDGNNNKGNLNDAIVKAMNKNITLFAIKPSQTKKDISISIEGPSKTFEGIETGFIIKLNGKGKEEFEKQNRKTTIWIDGLEKNIDLVNGIYEIKESFLAGKHTIKIEINYDDYFKENNKDLKEIIAEKKPSILSVSDKKLKWTEKIKEYREYHLIEQKTIPFNLQEYNAIILNDIREFSEAEVKRIREYLVNGGGVVFIGGKNSFEYGEYENKLIEDLMPSKVGLQSKKESEYNIIVLIDISSSTGTEQEGLNSIKKIEIEKAQAINIIKELKPKNRIGAIAFNTQAFKIADMDLAERNKDKIIENISSLQSGGGTIISEGINAAIEELANTKELKSSKVIILISDGKTQEYEKTADSAKKAEEKGIKIFTIGTGNDDVENLKKIAELSNGEYLLADKTKKASIVYNQFSKDTNLELSLANNEHFITKNTSITGRINGINTVITKNSAVNLVKAGENEIISTWKFGDGRSTTIATGEEFAKELFDRNEELLKRIVSWTTAQIESEERQTEKNKETVELKENELNEDFFKMVKDKGGKVFAPKEFIQSEIDKLKIETKKELTKEKQYYAAFFIEAAIMLFLIEIGLRKFVFDSM